MQKIFHSIFHSLFLCRSLRPACALRSVSSLSPFLPPSLSVPLLSRTPSVFLLPKRLGWSSQGTAGKGKELRQI